MVRFVAVHCSYKAPPLRWRGWGGACGIVLALRPAPLRPGSKLPSLAAPPLKGRGLVYSADPATVIVPFGHWPRIAGDYIASTRVGGRVKRPEPFKRTTYSTAWVPAGTQPKSQPQLYLRRAT